MGVFNRMVFRVGSLLAFLFLTSAFATIQAASIHITGPTADDVDTDSPTVVVFDAFQSGIITDLSVEITLGDGVNGGYWDNVLVQISHAGVDVILMDLQTDVLEEGSVLDAIFADGGSDLASATVLGTTTGTFNPLQPLSAFNGLPVQGPWTFTFQDVVLAGDMTPLTASALTVETLEFSSDIELSLEEPADGGVYTGISSVRGWAVGPDGIDRIEFFVDDEYLFDLPYGGSRTDVGSLFPAFPDSDQSGFAAAFNFNKLTSGMHTFMVRAIAPNDTFNEALSTVTVDKFHSNFIPGDEAMDFSDATITRDRTGMNVSDIILDGVPYMIRIEWDKSKQNVGIVEIEED